MGLHILGDISITRRLIGCRLYTHHYLHQQHIPWFSSLDLEWPRKIMDLRKVDIFNVISTVIIS